MWYNGKIIKGKGIARTLGFPTINLDNPQDLSKEKEGVYLCRVRVNKAEFNGLLYFGPRLVLNETKQIVEIYILDFDAQVYGERVEYMLKDFIRPPLNFSNFYDLKKQVEKDFESALKLLNDTR